MVRYSNSESEKTNKPLEMFLNKGGAGDVGTFPLFSPVKIQILEMQI